jgi:hypothetical protein
MITPRPVKPMTFPDLKPAGFEGEKPSLQWVAPTSLLIDGTYQRDLSERSVRLIRRMIENFAWNRMKPPIVVKVGAASLHIVDGQHTAIVAATLGIPQIPVFIVKADSVDERARAFVGHNSDRVAVSPFDIYRALLASGDPDAVDVDNVCKRAGVRIRTISPSSAIAEGDTACCGLIRHLVKRRGVIPARKTLQALVKAKRAPIGGADILAAENIVCVARTDIDIEVLSAVIRIDGENGLIQAVTTAKACKTPVWRELERRWLARIDRPATPLGPGQRAS